MAFRNGVGLSFFPFVDRLCRAGGGGRAGGSFLTVAYLKRGQKFKKCPQTHRAVDFLSPIRAFDINRISALVRRDLFHSANDGWTSIGARLRPQRRGTTLANGFRHNFTLRFGQRSPVRMFATIDDHLKEKILNQSPRTMDGIDLLTSVAMSFSLLSNESCLGGP